MEHNLDRERSKREELIVRVEKLLNSEEYKNAGEIQKAEFRIALGLRLSFLV